MPMLHGCEFPGCATLTLSPYCVEHELFISAEVEIERAQRPEGAAEVVAVRQATA
jgi:hypothetical protein